MYPNIQAYDRGVMFSPDGRLFQVDYAREAVRKGATSVGLVADGSVVLIAHKNVTEPLAVSSTVKKIFKLDAKIGVTYSGLVADGQHLVQMMRQKTQSHRLVYDETESVETVAKELADEMQLATQYGGVRPYAVSLLVAGFDNGPKLYEVDAGASFLGYMADAIGSGRQPAQAILAKDYKPDMKIDDAIKLGISVIKKVTEQKLTEDSLDMALITKKDGFSLLKSDQIVKYL